MDRIGTRWDWKFDRKKYEITASHRINGQLGFGVSYEHEDYGTAQVGGTGLGWGGSNTGASSSQGVNNGANLGGMDKITIVSFFMMF
jgi:hypothetical protein